MTNIQILLNKIHDLYFVNIDEDIIIMKQDLWEGKIKCNLSSLDSIYIYI